MCESESFLCRPFEDTFEDAQWGKSKKCNQQNEGTVKKLKMHSGEESNNSEYFTCRITQYFIVGLHDWKLPKNKMMPT